jgi:hypothetical protein
MILHKKQSSLNNTRRYSNLVMLEQLAKAQQLYRTYLGIGEGELDVHQTLSELQGYLQSAKTNDPIVVAGNAFIQAVVNQYQPELPWNEYLSKQDLWGIPHLSELLYHVRIPACSNPFHNHGYILQCLENSPRRIEKIRESKQTLDSTLDALKFKDPQTSAQIEAILDDLNNQEQTLLDQIMGLLSITFETTSNPSKYHALNNLITEIQQKTTQVIHSLTQKVLHVDGEFVFVINPTLKASEQESTPGEVIPKTFTPTQSLDVKFSSPLQGPDMTPKNTPKTIDKHRQGYVIHKTFSTTRQTLHVENHDLPPGYLPGAVFENVTQEDLNYVKEKLSQLRTKSQLLTKS